MKVVMNAVAAKIGGGVTFITNFLRYLSPLAGDAEFKVLIPPETVAKLGDNAPNVHIIPTRIGYSRWSRRLWWEQVTLRNYLRREKPDILFSSANFGMVGCPVKQILLIQNALYFSENFEKLFLRMYSPRIRTSYYLRRWLICESARHADLVIIPSQATLDALTRFASIPARKVLVNPFGQPPPCSAWGEKEPANAQRRSDESDPVKLLYVSYYMAHKNLTTLLKAMPLLNGRGNRRFHLTSNLNPTAEGANWIVTANTDLGLVNQDHGPDCVRLIGPLTAGETDKLYSQFDIFVFPSLVESFGFPMVEAMAHGLPVVAANTPINREICGEAAVYFSPLDPEDLARQVDRVASDQKLRAKLAAAGGARVAGVFQWDRHVKKFLEAARELLSPGR